MRHNSLFIAGLCLAYSCTASAQHRVLADSIVTYQMPSGGWAKNQDWLRGPDVQYMNRCFSTGVGSTIDNGATTSEMKVLAQAYAETHDERYREAFVRGLRYLFAMQYANGGFPQFYPVRKAAAYSSHITFNDCAMTNVMRLLRDVAEDRDLYAPLQLPKSLRRQAGKSFRKAVGCILKCQIRKDGRLTVWCQQHDEHTLAPAPARAFELASYTGHGETVDIILLLREIKNPSKAVRAAIDGAVEWLKQHAIHDMEVERFTNSDGKPDIRLVRREGAPLLWARYYDLDNAEPFFCDRDGQPRKRLEDIGYERRNGYSWLGTSPQKVIE